MNSSTALINLNISTHGNSASGGLSLEINKTDDDSGSYLMVGARALSLLIGTLVTLGAVTSTATLRTPNGVLAPGAGSETSRMKVRYITERVQSDEEDDLPPIKRVGHFVGKSSGTGTRRLELFPELFD